MYDRIATLKKNLIWPTMQNLLKSTLSALAAADDDGFIKHYYMHCNDHDYVLEQCSWN